MITVFHAINSDFWTAADKFDPKKFRNVAQVNTNDLDEAYKLTNNIDKPWLENKEVFPPISSNPSAAPAWAMSSRSPMNTSQSPPSASPKSRKSNDQRPHPERRGAIRQNSLYVRIWPNHSLHKRNHHKRTQRNLPRHKMGVRTQSQKSRFSNHHMASNISP